MDQFLHGRNHNESSIESALNVGGCVRFPARSGEGTSQGSKYRYGFLQRGELVGD
jgi:hypothetical protein